jgi:transcriptional regulator with XRE-family HTH domain
VTTVQPETGATGGPTVLRMMLGAQLRRLREGKGISRDAAGWEIRASESKISRMELGRVGFKERDVADLLTLYGVTDEQERATLLSLAREANQPGWWQMFGDVLPSWFQAYVGLEAAASVIRTYEVQFVPGLLQTEEYARAVIVNGRSSASPDEVERRVRLRMRRQELLARPGGPMLWAVVDEAALRRPIGGGDVMRDQMKALTAAAKLPNVRLQVVPLGSGGHAAEGGAFTILRFPDKDLPDVVYVEQLTSALYLEKREEVDLYSAAMERLSAEAEPPNRTVDILAQLLPARPAYGDLRLAEIVSDLGGDITDEYIARLCSGDRDNPTLQTIEDLAAALEVCPAAFVGGRTERVGDERPRRSFSAKLRHLFRMVHPPRRGPYTPEEVAEAINEDGRHGPIGAAYIRELLNPPGDSLPNPTLQQVLGLADHFGLTDDDGPQAAYFLDDELAAAVDAELANFVALRDAGVIELAARAPSQVSTWNPEMRRQAVQVLTQAQQPDSTSDSGSGGNSWVFPQKKRDAR